MRPGEDIRGAGGIAALLGSSGSGGETHVPLFKRVRRLIGERDVVVHECRHCGMTLDSKADDCNACDSEDVVQYIIE